MAYRREYLPIGKKQKKPAFRGRLLLAVVLVALCFQKDCRETAAELLIPGDREITWRALEAMAADLRTGEPLGEAAEAFCREILSHGN